MLSSKKLPTHLVAVWMVTNTAAITANAGVECPATHNGKPLASVELFDGPPSNKIEVIPENGRFVVPYRPRSEWDRFPPSTLGCTYRGSKDMVVIVLPRHVRVCEFPHYPRVQCH